MIKSIIFDLDDTLYPEIDYVKSGYKAVGKQIEKLYKLKNADRELLFLFEQSRLGVFDRFLKKHDLPRTEQTVGELLDVYRYHVPELTLCEVTENTLAYLKQKGYKLGIITDGSPKRQRAKIDSLGIERFMDKITVTDELGGIECRKPNPIAFRIMCEEFGILPEEAVYVGDNPQKDFAIKQKLPITTVQYRGHGVYTNEPYLYGIKPDYIIDNISELLIVVGGYNG